MFKGAYIPKMPRLLGTANGLMCFSHKSFGQVVDGNGLPSIGVCYSGARKTKSETSQVCTERTRNTFSLLSHCISVLSAHHRSLVLY